MMIATCLGISLFADGLGGETDTTKFIIYKEEAPYISINSDSFVVSTLSI